LSSKVAFFSALLDRQKRSMKQIHFPNWMEVLEQSPLPARAKKWFPITISYLRFCQRTRAGVNVQSARDFIEWGTEKKNPEGW
jgi:hypothetical protein